MQLILEETIRAISFEIKWLVSSSSLEIRMSVFMLAKMGEISNRYRKRRQVNRVLLHLSFGLWLYNIYKMDSPYSKTQISRIVY